MQNKPSEMSSQESPPRPAAQVRQWGGGAEARPPLQHLAIIMDGNGRWAEQRRRPRSFGHIRGARIARSAIDWVVDRGIPNLTLYAFSTENWSRPKSEIDLLMRLLGRNLRRERERLHSRNVVFRAIGDLTRLPADVREAVVEAENRTRTNSGTRVVFALSYGGRDEILHATRELMRRAVDGRLQPEALREIDFSSALYTSGLPDPDLVLRTSGESRISNFLLWQSAYSEFVTLPVQWPDFSELDLDAALKSYSARQRRFGLTSDQLVGSDMERRAEL